MDARLWFPFRNAQSQGFREIYQMGASEECGRGVEVVPDGWGEILCDDVQFLGWGKVGADAVGVWGVCHRCGEESGDDRVKGLTPFNP